MIEAKYPGSFPTLSCMHIKIIEGKLQLIAEYANGQRYVGEIQDRDGNTISLMSELRDGAYCANFGKHGVYMFQVTMPKEGQ